jgi:ubiquinone/menaquinone biosynthesis C-methylase UbiE
MRRFLRKTTLSREPLPLTMSGVRMGERVLQIGVNDTRLAGALAAKTGLSGHAAIAVPDDERAARARHGATESGVLVDIHVTPLQTLPFPDDGFDAIVIHSADGLLASFDDALRVGVLRECHRVLRGGGRLIAIESAPRTGLTALLHASPKPSPAYDASGGAAGALRSAGFKPVRMLAEREGFRFTEGLKGL